jgi:hypothetical protein
MLPCWRGCARSGSRRARPRRSLYPNEHDRYHINDTTAVRDDGGTVTFRFKTSCEEADQNCLEVPAGPFDVAARYYLPEPEIRSGDWTMPRPSRVEAERQRKESP